MYDVFVFAGTTEGRKIADLYRTRQERVCVFTATEYGGSLISPGPNIHVASGRLNKSEIIELLKKQTTGNTLVIDATHPYASIVTENIKGACMEAGRTYIRVLRNTNVPNLLPGQTETPVSPENKKDDNSDRALPQECGIHYVASTEEAAEFLKSTTGNVLLTTGSKELSAFTVVPDYENRLFARVLSLPSVAAACEQLGFRGRNLICMQGPFSEEFNIALIHQIHAEWLVTKETGVSGGFPEKIDAAAKTGCKVIIIGKPLSETGYSVEEFAEHFCS